MSTNNLLLETLIDPKEPVAIDMFPQTMGWIVSAVMLVIVLMVYLFRALKHWKANAHRRYAAIQVQELVINADDTSLIHDLRALNRVVKQCASVTYGNPKVASLTGEAWLNLLEQSGSKALDESLFNDWQNALYQPATDLSVDQFKQLVTWLEWWITHHEGDIVTIDSGEQEAVTNG